MECLKASPEGTFGIRRAEFRKSLGCIPGDLGCGIIQRGHGKVLELWLSNELSHGAEPRPKATCLLSLCQRLRHLLRAIIRIDAKKIPQKRVLPGAPQSQWVRFINGANLGKGVEPGIALDQLGIHFHAVRESCDQSLLQLRQLALWQFAKNPNTDIALGVSNLFQDQLACCLRGCLKQPAQRNGPAGLACKVIWIGCSGHNPQQDRGPFRPTDSFPPIIQKFILPLDWQRAPIVQQNLAPSRSGFRGHRRAGLQHFARGHRLSFRAFGGHRC